MHPPLKKHPDSLKYVNKHSSWHDWTLSIKSQAFDLMLDHHKPQPGGDTTGFKCGVCFSDNIERWDSWGTGSAAGVYEYREFKCHECQNHSLFERETCS